MMKSKSWKTQTQINKRMWKKILKLKYNIYPQNANNQASDETALDAV